MIWTARIGYRGADGIDVTRKSAHGLALAFAPSWHILRPILTARRRHQDIEPLWPGYVERYTDEMRASYRCNFPAWQWLLALPEVTLLCYCTDATRCHRTVLAEILRRGWGAELRGER